MMAERFETLFISRKDLYDLGRDGETGQHYLGIPVGIPHFDWTENYALSDEEYRALLDDPVAARAFADRCRARELDDRLLEPPRSWRGTPWQPS